MKRENGIIILDSLIPNWQKALRNKQVIPNDLCGPYYNGYWINNVENKNYFLKICKKSGLNDQLFIQIFMEELAKTVSIATTNSEIIRVNSKSNVYGIISDNYKINGYKIISGKEIIWSYLESLEANGTLKEVLEINSLDELYNTDFSEQFSLNSLSFIWEALEYYYRNNPNKHLFIYKIVEELARRFIYSFITMQYDFHLGNWELLDNEAHAFLVPMYDMELGFQKRFFDISRNNSMRAYESSIQSIYDSFKQFYFSSSSSFQLEVTRQLYILTPETLLNILMNLEKKYQVDKGTKIYENINTLYKEHYDELIHITQMHKKEEGKHL